jgi:hypothetical protein
METTCVHYSREYVGHPCIVALDRDRCAVADATGHVTAVNLRTKEVGPRLFVGAEEGRGSCHLRSLRRHPERPGVVAVATRGAHAAIGDLDRLAVDRIVPEQGGTVNAVAFSPDGRGVAIGTGAYALSGEPPPARVELWTLSAEGPPEYAGFTALPGACVDAIAWHPDGQTFACASGLRSQKAGFIAQVGAGDIRPRSFIEIASAGTGRICYDDRDAPGSHLAVAFKGGFRLLSAGNGKEAWRADRPDAPDFGLDFDIDTRARRVVLSNGAVLDARDGAEIGRFLAMKDCTSIAARPGGGYIGASSRGRIYCWD